MSNVDDLLKNTLLSLYKDCPDITAALLQCDFSILNYNFKKALFSRISEEEFNVVDTFLRSEEYKKYKFAIDSAAMSVTEELAEMIDFVTAQNDGGKH